MQKFSKSVLILIIGMACTKLTSFAENMVLAYQYGTSAISDAFIVSLTLPNILFGAIASSVSACFVAVFQKHNKNPDFGNQYVTALSLVLCILGIFVSFFISLNADTFVSFAISDINVEVVQIAAGIVKVISWSCCFIFLGGVLQGFFQSTEAFSALAFVSVPVNISITMFLIVSGTNIQLLSYGILISYIIQFLFSIYIALMHGFRINFNISKTKGYLLETLTLFLPLIAGNLINDVNVIIDKYFASSFGTGIISGLDYGHKVSIVLYSIVVNPLLTVFYPKIAKLVVKGNEEESFELMSNTIFFFEVFYGLVIILVFLLAKPICYLLFYGGSFENKSLAISSVSLTLYTLAIIPMAIRNTFEKFFLSKHDVKTPMLNTIFTIFTNVILNFELSRTLGFIGLPIATVVSFVLSDIYLFFSLKKNFGFNISHAQKNKKIKLILIVLLFVCYTFFLLPQDVMLLIMHSKFNAFATISSITLVVGFLYAVVVHFTNIIKYREVKEYIKKVGE